MSTSSSKFFPALTGLRALGALWVLAFHLGPQWKLFFGNAAWVETGFYGVDLFFVLSGFVIAHSYHDRLQNWSDYRHFLTARLKRLYPLHLLMLLAILAMVTLAPSFGFTINRSEDYRLADFFAHLFMISAWQFPAHLSWNHYAWAVSAEWLAYLITPVYLAALFRLQRTDLLLLAALAFALLCPLISATYPFPSATAYALPRILSGFGLGVIAYRFYHLKSPAAQNSILSLLILAAIIACLWLEHHFENLRFTALPFFALLILSLTNSKDLLVRLLSSPVCRYLGRISYALYITQFVVIMAIKKIMPAEHLFYQPTWIKMGYLGMETICIFLAAMLCHYAIEKPMKKLRGHTF